MIGVTAAIAIAAVLIFSSPVRAGVVLMTRDGFVYWLNQKMLPGERRLATLESRAAAVESRLADWEYRSLYRIYLWPDQPRAEYYNPGGGYAGSADLDAAPAIVDGRTMVPLRFIGEALGAEVIWDGETRQVIYITEARRILLTVGQRYVLIDGQTVEIDAEPRIIGGRTMVPVRFVGQWLGAAVKWDEALKRVEIAYLKDRAGLGIYRDDGAAG